MPIHDFYTFAIVNSQEDMLEMFLTQKERRFGALPPLKMHEECELLLESYVRELTHLNLTALALRKKIQNSQDLVNIALDNYRNRMIKINVNLGVATVSLATGTCGTSFSSNQPKQMQLVEKGFPFPHSFHSTLFSRLNWTLNARSMQTP